ncbi:MAG: serine/threonine protein kinase [Thermoleophilaceae bacterium]|nr:serine/threonine protein kinase [Thermoleophilaceae bacterium]
MSRSESALTERLPEARLVLGRYRLDRRLGAGGFGVVWLAWDEKLEREVAVKAMPLERGSGERVEREARAAARLNHPGIVAVYELASDEHEVYLVSELVRGRTLAELLRAGAVSDRDAARIGVVLCDALEHAHARGVIHRDVKPQNVMVVAEPAAGAGFAKLADFGVAHVASGDPLTHPGDVIGTLAYMAPEQAEGGAVTPACDVYSLALTLYEAWTGANPMRGNGLAATVRRLGRPLPSLHSRRRDLPPELADAIDAALEPDPALRPPPGELRAVLAQAAAELSDEGGLVEPATLRRVGLPTTRTRGRFLRRRRDEDTPLPVTPLEEPAARPRLDPAAGLGMLGRVRRPYGEPPPLGSRVAARAMAGAALGCLLLAGLVFLGEAEPESAPLAAAAGALATALMPRLGWLASAAALCGWLATAGGRPGSALVVLAAALAVPLLLPRAGLLWSLPVAAPLLGALGLAPAFVGLAALAPTMWRRAGLAAAGLVWLFGAEALTGDALLFGVPDAVPDAGGWQESVSAAARDVIAPIASSPQTTALIVWAGFAALLPFLLRGRWLAMDCLGAALWAAGLMAALAAVGDLTAGGAVLDQARGAVAGALVGAVVAVAISQSAPPTAGWRAQPVTTA